MHTPTGQLDFGHARAQSAGPRPRSLRQRAREHARVLRAVEGRSESERPVRAAALDALKVALVGYLEQLGVGAAFQAADFTRWLDATGARPDPRTLAPQGLGGLFLKLAHSGLIQKTGYAMTGDYGGANSSMRPRYIVRSLDLASLKRDWPCVTRPEEGVAA